MSLSTAGVLSGTAATGSGGVYPIEITASNGVSPDATQAFTLTVDEAAAFTSADQTIFTVGNAGSFSVTTTGFPAPSLSEIGSLPAGVTFADNGDGTATFSGTPAVGSAGSYPLTVTARISGQGDVSQASQSFTLSVDAAPVADAGGPYTVAEGGNVTLDADQSSDPDGDTLTYSWDLNGDGAFGDATGVNPTLTWAQLEALGLSDGPAAISNVTVRVDDGHGHTVISPATGLTIENVPPQGSISGGQSLGGSPGQPLSVTFSASDPSPQDQAAGFSFAIDWGDGSGVQTVKGTSPQAVSHTYSGVGVYRISMTATDKDGGTKGAAFASVTIASARIVPDPCDAGSTALMVSGTSGNDSISISPARGVRQVAVTLNGVPQGTFGPFSRIIVYGRAGDDSITVERGIAQPSIIYGGDGDDTIRGGNGTGILIGGNGDDDLTGGGVSDILIGGSGADTLVGGSGEDILIAGSTSYDEAASGNQAVLCAISAEWSHPLVSYHTRIDHLTGAATGGLNGTSYLLGPGAGQTVFNDVSPDTLTGGFGRDWYLLNEAGGGALDMSNRTLLEVATDL